MFERHSPSPGKGLPSDFLIQGFAPRGWGYSFCSPREKRVRGVSIARPPQPRAKVVFDPQADVLGRTGGAMPLRTWRGIPTATVLAEIGHQRDGAAGALRRMKPARG